MSCVGSWADTSLEGSGCDLSLGGTQKGSHASDLFSSRSSSASQEAEPAPTLLPAHLEVPGAAAEASVEIKATSEPEECPPPASALELQATTTSIPAAALDQAPACGWLLQELTEKSPVLPEKPSPALVPDPAEAMSCLPLDPTPKLGQPPPEPAPQNWQVTQPHCGQNHHPHLLWLPRERRSWHIT